MYTTEILQKEKDESMRKSRIEDDDDEEEEEKEMKRQQQQEVSQFAPVLIPFVLVPYYIYIYIYIIMFALSFIIYK